MSDPKEFEKFESKLEDSLSAVMNFTGTDNEKKEYFSTCMFDSSNEPTVYLKIQVDHEQHMVRFYGNRNGHHAMIFPILILRGEDTHNLEKIEIEYALEPQSYTHIGKLEGFQISDPDKNVVLDASFFEDGKTCEIYENGDMRWPIGRFNPHSGIDKQYLNLNLDRNHPRSTDFILKLQLVALYFKACYYSSEYIEAFENAVKSYTNIDVPVDQNYINMCNMVEGTSLNYEIAPLGSHDSTHYYLLDFGSTAKGHKYYILQVSTIIDELVIREQTSLKIILIVSNIGSREEVSTIYTPSASIGYLDFRWSSRVENYQRVCYDRLGVNRHSTVNYYKKPKSTSDLSELVYNVLLSKLRIMIGYIKQSITVQHEYQFTPNASIRISPLSCKQKEQYNFDLHAINPETCVLSIVTVFKALYINTSLGNITSTDTNGRERINDALRKRFGSGLSPAKWRGMIADSKFKKLIPSSRIECKKQASQSDKDKNAGHDTTEDAKSSEASDVPTYSTIAKTASCSGSNAADKKLSGSNVRRQASIIGGAASSLPANARSSRSLNQLNLPPSTSSTTRSHGTRSQSQQPKIGGRMVNLKTYLSDK